ncbi:MAG TPA: ASKHA domain-containing protein [Terriglobales bacterium]|nr:ASKHA domain-containing protein [Terriglobales bacterium]
MMGREDVADEVAQPDTADCQVTFQPLGKRVTVSAGTTLLEAGRRAGILLSAACGGVGVCGRCRISVVSGDMFPPDKEEMDFLRSGPYASGTRLACEARVASSVAVDVTPGAFTAGQQLQTATEVALPTSDPIIESHQIDLSPPSLDDASSDYRRVAGGLVASTGWVDWTMTPAVAAQLSDFVRQDQLSLTTYTRGGQIVGFANPGRSPLGLAVDLGCTKIAAYLVDLGSGIRLAARGMPNPQITYGEDLMTRLVYADSADGRATALADLARNSIAQLASLVCEDAKTCEREIADVCVVGNTAMMHLLLKLPVSRLLRAPFVASIDRDLDLPAGDLGGRFAPAANVHILPSIGGFVGADHVAMILARGIDESAEVTVGLDIGTNTEIVVRDPRSPKFLTTSVPSGPVFEGAHVSDGMRAASGAIEKFYSATGELQYTTIDSARPVGMCGSGIVDLIAELHRSGTIDDRGHLVKSRSGVRSGASGMEFLVVNAVRTGNGRDIVITQRDITQVQLAKAAIFAGIDTLLQLAEVSYSAVERVEVAGAFGSYLDLRSAIAIGMLPRFPNAEYRQVGNAAGGGAQLALVSRAARARAREIAGKAERIELKRYPTFDRTMARATRIPKAEPPSNMVTRSESARLGVCRDDNHP